MFELPDINQWKKLFSISEKLLVMEPWNHYKNNEIITIKDIKNEEPIFCSMLGNINNYFGISLYCGYKNLSKYFNVLLSPDEQPLNTIIGSQECLTVYFGEKILMGQGDFTAMEYGEYIPKDEPMNQIFFRTYSPGLAPWYIDAKEAAILNNTLESLYLGLRQAQKDGIKPNYKNGETLYISNENHGEWKNTIKTLPMLTMEEKVIKMKDELSLARLKKLPRISHSFELDLSYLTNPVSAKYDSRPIFPRIIIAANHDEGIVDNQLILDEEANEVEELLTFLIDMFKEKGRPRLLIIRENSIKYLIQDLCEKINVPVEERNNLEIIDDFLELVGNYHTEK